MRSAAIALVAIALFACAAPASADADSDAIQKAVLNYANSAYLVDVKLVDESVHPRLQKVGYVSRDGQPYSEHWMNFDQLKELVSYWNKEGRFDKETARREVRILDQLDQTAIARLDAEWGIDYLQLAKIDGKWMIINVLWQTYPTAAPAGSGDTE